MARCHRRCRRSVRRTMSSAVIWRPRTSPGDVFSPQPRTPNTATWQTGNCQTVRQYIDQRPSLPAPRRPSRSTSSSTGNLQYFNGARDRLLHTQHVSLVAHEQTAHILSRVPEPVATTYGEDRPTVQAYGPSACTAQCLGNQQIHGDDRRSLASARPGDGERRRWYSARRGGQASQRLRPSLR